MTSPHTPVMPISPEMRIVTIRDLDKPQWDAALYAATVLARGNPNNADDRREFRSARASLVDQLPNGANATQLISDAVKWSALNDIAGAFAGIDTTQDNMGGMNG